MHRIKQPRGYRQVSNGRFRAEIRDDGRTRNLGTFLTEEEAAEAFRIANEDRLRRMLERQGYYLEDGVNYEINYTVFDDGTIFGPTGIKIKPIMNPRGYLQCTINGRSERIHRVVAECFIPNLFNKSDVNHINGDKTDNRVCNLEWCTRQENTRHAYNTGLAHGTGKSRSGEKSCKAKLTWEDVQYIRENYNHRDPNFNQVGLARKFNIGTTAIYDILHNNTWVED